MNKEAKIYVAGHRGLVGSAIVRALQRKGFKNILTKSSGELDLRRQAEVEAFFDSERPEYVFLAAAKVGGILANSTYKAEFIYDNVMIASNIIHSAYKFGVKKVLNLGSSCIYPKLAPQPMKEEYLLTGPLEETNEPYAIAKISAIKLVRYYNEQYGTNFMSLMPTNLYGPNDNYNLETSHVLPALIRKSHLAKLLEEEKYDEIKKDLKTYPVGFGVDNSIDYDDRASLLDVLKRVGIFYDQKLGKVVMTLWGSGEVFREFLYVEELAEACVYFMERVDAADVKKYCPDYFVNVGVGKDIKIKDLALLIKEIVGFKGLIVHDTSKPDGTPRKVLDISRMLLLGWQPKVPLADGIRWTYEAYLRYSPSR